MRRTAAPIYSNDRSKIASFDRLPANLRSARAPPPSPALYSLTYRRTRAKYFVSSKQIARKMRRGPPHTAPATLYCNGVNTAVCPAGFDILVIGGGLVGGAIAWGAARAGARTALLDEGDIAFRAARGNFGLVWVQSKGAGMPPYAHWTRRSAELWPSLADMLLGTTGTRRRAAPAGRARLLPQRLGVRPARRTGRPHAQRKRRRGNPHAGSQRGPRHGSRTG